MQKLIQWVHIGKSQLRMDDESYRWLLKQQFNKRSSKDLTRAELQQLVNILQDKGAAIGLPFARSKTLNPMQKKLWAIWKSMGNKGIITLASSQTLNRYVQRMFVGKMWHELDSVALGQVIESLKQWQKRWEG